MMTRDLFLGQPAAVWEQQHRNGYLMKCLHVAVVLEEELILARIY